MKKSLVIFTSFLITLFATAQSDRYEKAMLPKILAMDTIRNTEELLSMANAFERIADAEKTQWLPYYYAALAHVNAGNMMALAGGTMGGHAAQTDPEADKAETLLGKAEKLTTDNAELWIVKKMIASLRMMGDPMNRYMKYGPEASAALQTAKQMDPENPRVYLLEGQDKFFTPEQFGGSKAEAKKLFETARKKFESFKPAGNLYPSWGWPTLQYFIAQAN